jgi:hypothetical protein
MGARVIATLAFLEWVALQIGVASNYGYVTLLFDG